MNLETLKDEIAVHADYKDLDQAGWEAKIEFRGAHVKFGKDLDHALNCYARKIPLLRKKFLDPHVKLENPDGSLRTQAQVDDDKLDVRGNLLTKIARLIDKCACCLKEQELRKNELVIRNPHNTDYYIDYVNGNDANTGLSIAQHWKTITKYTTATVRSAGDRAFLRANTTWTQGTEAVDITFDEDGTIDLYIELIGADSVTNDPWSDSSDVKPIIDFEDAAYQLLLNADDNWRITRLDFRQGNDSAGAFRCDSADNIRVVDCVIRDGTGAGSEGVYLHGSSRDIEFNGCSWTNNNGTAVYIEERAIIRIVDCTVDAGAVDPPSFGFWVRDGSQLDIIDTTIAGSNAFTDKAIQGTSNVRIRMRNVTFGTETYSIGSGSSLVSEDNDGTFEEQLQLIYGGQIDRDTGTVRGGGADSSAKMTPNSICGLNQPLILGDRMRGFRPIWKAAGSYTATVYVRVGSAWDSALTAAECYLVTSELDNAGNATRVERQSTETINNAGSWTALTTSISPARDGFVYFWIYLAEFEDATEHIFVDILPMVA